METIIFLDVLPTRKRRLPGRSKKKRRLEALELKKENTQIRPGGHKKKFSVCRALGHKRNNCPTLPKQGREERPTEAATLQPTQPTPSQPPTSAAPTPPTTPIAPPQPSQPSSTTPTPPVITTAPVPITAPPPIAAVPQPNQSSYGIRKMRPKMQRRRPPRP